MKNSCTGKEKTTSAPMDDILRFALKQIDEGVLVLSLRSNGEPLSSSSSALSLTPIFQIRYANEAFLEMTQLHGDDCIGKGLDEISLFAKEQSSTISQVAVDVLCNRIGKEHDFVVKKRFHGMADVHVAFSYFDHANICCIFRTGLSQQKSERLKALELMDEFSEVEVSYLELEDAGCEEPKLKYHFSSKRSSSKELARTRSVDSEEAQKESRDLVQHLRSIQGTSNIGEHVRECRSHSVFATKTRFLGYSPRTNHPLFFLLSWDQTAQSKRVEEISLFRGFFNNATVLLMGAIQFMDSQKSDWTYELVNPASAREFTGDQSMTEWLTGKRASQVGMSEEKRKLFAKHATVSEETGEPQCFELYCHESRKLYSCCISHFSGDRFSYVIQDISYRKQLELELESHKQDLEEKIRSRTIQLEEAIEVKQRFLATMSHEIRTPLSGVLGSLSLLSESALTAEQQSMVNIAQICGEQLLVSINDVLDLLKMEENKMTLENTPFSLRNVLEESLEVVSFDADKKHIELICDVEEEVQETVLGDVTRLRQVCINLVSNAIKFSNGGEVVVSARSEDLMGESECKITVSVKDRGIGIPEDAQPKIFQPFTQADNTTTRRFGGSGLGLSICKRLIELMGGAIWFESMEGQGTTFYFTITVPKNSQSVPARRPRSGKRILVVEPNAKMLDLLKRKLEFWGFDVDAFSSSALAKRHSSKVDLALVDSKEMDHLSPLVERSSCAVAVMSSGQVQETACGNYNVRKPIRFDQLLQFLYKNMLANSNSVPVAIDSPKRLRLSESSSSIRSSSTILIAEDNEMNQKVIARLLQSLHYSNIKIVDNGLKAIEMLKTTHFDVVLMDIMMPEMGGIEATERIRKEIPEEEQPAIIAVTADAFLETKKKCIACGMNDILTKPISKMLLMETLRKYLPC
eukprot:TRINITY_DN3119_c0_g1_i1.p1 TRINITY_DN3119_c0_g1~~TRINITY_DN3119_c0_g1_i1.p1  ORF type:complete len:920 (+),score=244.20 TRINITY_DN3119_c0_g1_i1:120-2879(+)